MVDKMYSSSVRIIACAVLILALFPRWAYALDSVHIFSAPSDSDFRLVYPNELLVTALEKTVDKYGEFELVTEPEPKNFKHKKKLMMGDKAYVISGAQRSEWDRDLLAVRVPITRGVMGLRVFFINHDKQADFAKLSTLEEIKQVPLGTGHNWASTIVFEHHGFNVVKTRRYDQMFEMLDQGDFQILSRGAHEIVSEKEVLSRQYPKLHIEDSVLIDIPLPVYFYVSANSHRLAKRIEDGLLVMMSDGSFEHVFDKYFAKYLSKLQLDKRRIYHLENPYLPQGSSVYDVRKLINMKPTENTE